VRVPVTDLIGSPGASRALARAVPVDEFGDDPWGNAEDAVEDPVDLDLHLDSVVDGILVRGELRFEVRLACARCLVPQRRSLQVDVAELFVDPTKLEAEEELDDPGYEIIDDLTAIDLSTMVRDALLIDLPVRVLCREDCQGLCPVCGADRNLTDCGHRPGDEPDPRWAKLQELDLPTDRP
jgi:uncharacterized protein